MYDVEGLVEVAQHVVGNSIEVLLEEFHDLGGASRSLVDILPIIPVFLHQHAPERVDQTLGTEKRKDKFEKHSFC